MPTGNAALFIFIGIIIFIGCLPYIIVWSRKIPAIKKHWRAFWEWQCQKYGHLTSGPETGLPQAHCRRCGRKTWHAADFCDDRVAPWGEYE